MSKNGKKVVCKYYIGSPINRINGICRRAFLEAYRMKNASLVSLTKEIRLGRWGSCPAFSDRTNTCGRSDAAVDQKYKEIEDTAERHGVVVSQEQIANMVAPNSNTITDLIAWMEDFFRSYGDMEPNRFDEIHIDFITIQEVHRQYLLDREGKVHPEDLASVKDVGETWKRCFR